MNIAFEGIVKCLLLPAVIIPICKFLFELWKGKPRTVPWKSHLEQQYFKYLNVASKECPREVSNILIKDLQECHIELKSIRTLYHFGIRKISQFLLLSLMSMLFAILFANTETMFFSSISAILLTILSILFFLIAISEIGFRSLVFKVVKKVLKEGRNIEEKKDIKADLLEEALLDGNSIFTKALNYINLFPLLLNSFINFQEWKQCQIDTKNTKHDEVPEQ